MFVDNWEFEKVQKIVNQIEQVSDHTTLKMVLCHCLIQENELYPMVYLPGHECECGQIYLSQKKTRKTALSQSIRE